MNRIVCGKFHSYISLKPKKKSKKIRIGSKNPNSLKEISYIPISVFHNQIMYNNLIYTFRDFFSQIDKSIAKKLVVLTIKEYHLILQEIIDFDLKVAILELKYPFFHHIKFISNIEENYYELKKLIYFIRNQNITGNSFSQYVVTKALYKVERKIRFKNSLDYLFSFAYKNGYQEVFKLKEEREERIIISMDFNSMYLDCMKGEFLNPKNVKYKNYQNQNIDIDTLSNGLYKVILKYPKKSFFNNFHPFKYNRLFKSLYFKMEEEQQLEILLFKNELLYYRKYFCEIDIVEGLISINNIKHPLYEYGKVLYKKRLIYKHNGNKLMNNYYKFKLAMLHSSTNIKRYKIYIFNNKNELINHISTTFMIDFEEKDIEYLNKEKDFSIHKKGTQYILKTRDYESNDVIFSFSSQVLANSRLKMLETIEEFLKTKSVEICYCNIDSIHISIEKAEVDNFLEKNKNLVSDDLGKLKIESISDRGYWFDLGRYWLFKNNKVIQFKNAIFNSKGNKSLFLKNRKINNIYYSESFNYIKPLYINIFNSFSYNKRIKQFTDNDKNIEYIRYNFKEIENLSVASKTYENEVLNSKELKIDLFNSIATV